MLTPLMGAGISELNRRGPQRPRWPREPLLALGIGSRARVTVVQRLRCAKCFPEYCPLPWTVGTAIVSIPRRGKPRLRTARGFGLKCDVSAQAGLLNRVEGPSLGRGLRDPFGASSIKGAPSPRSMALPSRQISLEALGAGPGTFWRPRKLGVRTGGVITSGALHPPPPMGASTPAASLPLSASAAGTSSQLPEKGRKPRGPDGPSPPLPFPGETEAAKLEGRGELGPFRSAGKQLPKWGGERRPSNSKAPWNLRAAPAT